MLDKARQSMEAGATGLIFGRNVWQREHGESLRFAAPPGDYCPMVPEGGEVRPCRLGSGNASLEI
jgi:fructose-bisphosphate aldolase, class I